VEIDRKLICVNCNAHLKLLEEEKRINDERIKKLEEHRKLELKNPTSEETMKRIEHNLQIEYKKRDGITKTMDSKINF